MDDAVNNVRDQLRLVCQGRHRRLFLAKITLQWCSYTLQTIQDSFLDENKREFGKFSTTVQSFCTALLDPTKMSFKVIFSETFAIVHLCLVYTYSSRTDNSCFQVAQDFLTLSQVGTDNFSSPWLAYFCELKTSVIFVTANAIASSTSCLNRGFSVANDFW